MVCDTIIFRWIGTVSEKCLYSENACSSFQQNTGNEQMDLMVLISEICNLAKKITWSNILKAPGM
jgi:hypothetical protein